MGRSRLSRDTLVAILNSLVGPIVFVDREHVIRYVNRAAIDRFRDRGGEGLVGQSIFDCHNERSNRIILEVFDSFLQGEDERFLAMSKDGYRVFMRAVRDAAGRVIGYYERYEKA